MKQTRKRIKLGFLIGFATLLLWGCNNRPKHVIPEDKMVDLLTDLQLADALNSMTPADRANSEDLAQSILDQHGVSREDLDSTIAYYGRNMDEYAELYDKVNIKINKKRAKFGDEDINVITGSEIWPYSPFMRVDGKSLYDGFLFNINGNSLQPGESLTWKMRMTSADGAEATLGVEYSDGSSSFVSRSPMNGRNLEIALFTDTVKTAKRIFGHVRIPKPSMPVWVDSISLMKHDFDSTEYYRIRSQHTFMMPPPKPKKIEQKDTIDTVK